MYRIDTVGELIAELRHYDEDTPVRLAQQPNWPFEYTIAQVVCTPDDVEDGNASDGEDRVVWLAEGAQIDYLPGEAARVLGWR